MSQFADDLFAQYPTVADDAERSPLFRVLAGDSGFGQTLSLGGVRFRVYRLPLVRIDGESFWISEGDLLLDRNDLRLHALQIQRPDDKSLFAGTRAVADGEELELVAMVNEQGALRSWPHDSVLSYHVERETFDNCLLYEKACTNMTLAATKWMQACNIKFESKTDRPTFRVEGPLAARSRGFAAATSFFPDAKPARRVLRLYSYYFAFTHEIAVGTLLHELGHVLGFAHEHLRREAPLRCRAKKLEREKTKVLTGYDPGSIMHYFCDGARGRKWELTPLDVSGARKIYGEPLS
jgi:hypothetical protein